MLPSNFMIGPLISRVQTIGSLNRIKFWLHQNSQINEPPILWLELKAAVHSDFWQTASMLTPSKSITNAA
jgi:hypothetical protein